MDENKRLCDECANNLVDMRKDPCKECLDGMDAPNWKSNRTLPIVSKVEDRVCETCKHEETPMLDEPCSNCLEWNSVTIEPFTRGEPPERSGIQGKPSGSEWESKHV